MILPSSGVMRTAYPKSSAKTFIALKGEQVTYMGISYVPYVHCTQSVRLYCSVQAEYAKRTQHPELSFWCDLQ